MERKTDLKAITRGQEHKVLLKHSVGDFLQEFGPIEGLDRKGAILYLVEVLRFALVHIKANAPDNLGLGVCNQIGVLMMDITFSKDTSVHDEHQCCLEYLVEDLQGRTFRLNEISYGGTPTYPILDKTSSVKGAGMQFMTFDLSYGNQAALRIEYLGHLLSELDKIENEIHKETYPTKESVLWNKINNESL